MECRIRLTVDLPATDAREDVKRAVQKFLIVTASELLQCSVRMDEREPAAEPDTTDET